MNDQELGVIFSNLVKLEKESFQNLKINRRLGVSAALSAATIVATLVAAVGLSRGDLSGLSSTLIVVSLVALAGTILFALYILNGFAITEQTMADGAREEIKRIQDDLPGFKKKTLIDARIEIENAINPSIDKQSRTGKGAFRWFVLSILATVVMTVATCISLVI
ncbi:TPA: hypothetical protein DHW58_00235 [Patescibacteria group bacterium]|uniref:Uncharacterized protein n=2 Tax=Bacteria division Kazan-3B-28 TaxID=1798534 RepID=A0A0G2A423_UNCK3|nr:MAG: hypothetical protein VE98_C0001G0043 [candidate division Kazan bacterium GW2011_GWA1_50_15]KKW25674.1 MAG: hypothetical protein VE99_C0001G0313 [candidate division Kazan bacterium GW2011_GWC1_52_13]KKW26979.1 MAG: hypothetical protein VF00_C0002G0306 [candidate division Kazan bacterium GW2011_GWB1_52_7]HAV66033.1 hypothetical protein [Patescibacteria group bacterium]HCL47407.1 hypothetical protein [Patescibacteria group bacterium]